MEGSLIEQKRRIFFAFFVLSALIIQTPNLAHGANSSTRQFKVTQTPDHDRPLFHLYPKTSAIPFISLLKGESALQPMKRLEHYLQGQGQNPSNHSLWVKRDDLSDEAIGGNKARKMEFLLGQAFKKKKSALITFGMWGSNHALATALAGKHLGLPVTLHLGPQPPTPEVKNKLLAMHALGAKVIYHKNKVSLGLAIAKETLSHLWDESFVINPGGSTAVGTLGYVNAFLEFIEQWRQMHHVVSVRDVPPAEIYVPMGTAGTAAGLLVGRCLAGVEDKIKVVAIGISHGALSNGNSVLSMARKSWRYLKKFIPNSPECHFTLEYAYEKKYSAPGYGGTKMEVFQAMDLLKEVENLDLDPTYSGKAFHAYLESLEVSAKKEQQPKPGQTPGHKIFWLTYNKHDLDGIINKFSWHHPAEKWRDLPASFHILFASGNDE